MTLAWGSVTHFSTKPFCAAYSYRPRIPVSRPQERRWRSYHFSAPFSPCLAFCSCKRAAVLLELAAARREISCESKSIERHVKIETPVGVYKKLSILASCALTSPTPRVPKAFLFKVDQRIILLLLMLRYSVASSSVVFSSQRGNVGHFESLKRRIRCGKGKWSAGSRVIRLGKQLAAIHAELVISSVLLMECAGHLRPPRSI